MDSAAKIHDIAAALGISIGTVDRALHDRPGINPLTKARVMQMAKTLGYRPNPAARALSRRRRSLVSINLPQHVASFWDAVRAGIENEATSLENSGIELQFRTFSRLGADDELAAFEDALASDVSGIVMATGNPKTLRNPILRASRKKIPVVAVTADAPGTSRLAVVSIDSPASGALAGELLSRFMRGSGKVAVLTGDLAVTDHTEKYAAFRSTVTSLFPSIQIIEPVQNHDDEVEAYDKCRMLFAQNQDLAGLYVSTANSAPVLRALEDSGLVNRITLVTTDLFPLLADQLRTGGVTATLYQRPRAQGQLAFRLLNDFLVGGRCPTQQVRLAPHLVMRSNLDFFAERMAAEARFQEMERLPSVARRTFMSSGRKKFAAE